MIRIAAALAALVGLCSASAWLGYRAGETHGAQARADTLQTQLQATTDSVQRQIAVRTKQTQAQQEASTRWLVAQVQAHDDLARITVDIGAWQPPAVAASCPDVLGTPDFRRLYDAAAGAGAVPAAPPGADGVHDGSDSAVSRGAGDTAGRLGDDPAGRPGAGNPRAQGPGRSTLPALAGAGAAVH